MKLAGSIPYITVFIIYLSNFELLSLNNGFIFAKTTVNNDMLHLEISFAHIWSVTKIMQLSWLIRVQEMLVASEDFAGVLDDISY